MKKIFNIFTALLLLSVVGCTKDIDLDSDITSNDVGEKIPVTLNLSTEDTRVYVDGTSVSWSEYEYINVIKVIDDQYMSDFYLFEIDSESISSDGKSASFKGSIGTWDEISSDHTVKYIAVAGTEISIYGGGYYYDDDSSFPYYDYEISLYNSYFNTYITAQQSDWNKSIDLLMVSDYFTLDESDIIEEWSEFEKEYSKSNLKFNNRSAIIALNIYLDNATGQEAIQTLSLNNYGDFSSGDSPFSSYISMSATADGVELTTIATRSSYDLSVSSWDALSSSEPVTYYIPVVWNTNIETIDSNNFCSYFVDFKTHDNQYSDTQSISATKVLEDGHLYSCDVRFDANNLTTGATDQVAPLLEFYELLGGGERSPDNYPGFENSESWELEEWEAFENWMNSAFVLSGWNEWTDVSDWDGVYTDDLGYVISIYLYWQNINCELTNEAIEALAPLTKLESFNIQYSGLTGELPEALTESSTITYINLKNNDIEGAVPESYGTYMANGGSLYISGNRLSGDLPTTITDNTSVWSTFSLNNLSQQSGYGFTNLPAIYLSQSWLTSSDGTMTSTTDIFAENELTVVYSAYDYESWYIDIFSTITTLCSTYSDLGSLLIYDSFSADSVDPSIPGYVYASEGEITSDSDSGSDDTLGTKSSTTVTADSDGDVVSSDSSIEVGDSDFVGNTWYFNSVNITTSWPYSFVIVDRDGEILYTQGDLSGSSQEQIEEFVTEYFSTLN